MKNINKTLGLLFVMTVVGLLVGCSGQETKVEDNNQALTAQATGEIEKTDKGQEVREEVEETEGKEKVELVTAEARNEWRDGVVYIDAKIKNNSEKALKQVVIELNFLNKDKEITDSVDYPYDVNIDSNSEYIASLEIPNGQVYYDFDVKVKSYDIE